MTAPLVGLMICCCPFTAMGSGVQKENFFFASVLRGCFHKTWPEVLFNATKNGSLAPSQLNTSASPTTTGEEPPWPGTGVFHAMFFDRLLSHSSGTRVALETPCPVGPRNCGHSSAAMSDGAESSSRKPSTLAAAPVAVAFRKRRREIVF